MTDSQRLLADYIRNGSEAAFRELVNRYLDLVYSTAVRLVDGDTHLAQDVAQEVFADLARLARRFSGEVKLGGWLHRHTCFVAGEARRSERRRQNRERQAAQMNALEDHAETRIAQLAPFLDNAINQLNAADRMAIVLRFFEGRDLRSVGQELQTSEDAAQKRVTRALGKLRGLLARRGMALSAAGLASVLGAEAVTAAPTGLAAGISATALAAAATTGGSLTAALIHFMAMTKLKVAVGTIVTVGIGTAFVLEHQAQVRLRQENQALHQQAVQLAGETLRLSNLVAQASEPASLPEDQLSELLKLRGEVGVLRRQRDELSQLRAGNRQPGSAAPANPTQTASTSQQLPRELPRESWAFVGYADPESAFQSTLWATCSGDIETVKASFSPEFRQRLGNTPDEALQAKLASNQRDISGYRILLQEAVSDDTVHITAIARNRAGQDVKNKERFIFKRIDSEWKFDGEYNVD